MQVAADLDDVFEEALFFHDRQIFQADAAGQRTSAKRCTVLPGGNRGGKMLLGQKRPERQSRGDRLGDGDNIGHYAEALKGENLAGATESALDLVEDERGVVMIRQGAAGQQKFLRTLKDAAFAKNGFEHNGAGV